MDLAAKRVRRRRRLAARSGGAARHLVALSRRRWCCTKPTCAFIAASCATSRGRCAICAVPTRRSPTACRACRRSMALNYAALCMQNQARTLKGVTRLLTDELERQVLPDGGHASRDPSALIELLLDLLPLRQAFAARNVPPPAALNNAIDRMMPMLRFFRHGDGNFALFNGMGPTPHRSGLDRACLRRCAGPAGRECAALGLSARAGRRCPADRRCRTASAAGAELRGARRLPCHSSCSSKNRRIVVNCGLPGNEPRDLASRGARERCAFDRDLQ